jgi:raffinose/stachyose/melibiose transport system substrate-binding protein
MCAPLTFGAVRLVDFNRDGMVGTDELFVGLKIGRIDFNYPPFEARFQMLRHLTDQFQSGFTGLGRDEAVFLFAQQRAVFITTGTWDAGSLEEQARGVFELGIMDFPFPTEDDPEFGRIVEGQLYERPTASFPFAITRTCKHPEVALDFLRFLSSRANNEEMNRIIGWIPAIRGTRMSPLMSAFEPHLEGVYSAMPPTLGGETIIKWQQLFALFQIGQIDYSELMRQYKPFYLDKGTAELEEIYRNRTRGLVRDEQFLTGYRSRVLAATGSERASREIKYRQLMIGRLVTRDLGVALLVKRLAEGKAPNATAPYAFSPAVIETVRAKLKATGKEVGLP